MSVVEIIKHYQRSLAKCSGDEDRILHCVGKLYNLPITVQHLQDTGIGKTVNALRKYDGECGDAAKACVAKWKAMVAAEESSDQETEQQAPEEPEESDDNSPPDLSIDEKPRSSEKSRPRSHREEPDSKRIKEDRSSSSSQNNYHEVSKSSNKREESTNKIRDRSRDDDREKRHRDKIVSSTANSSSSNSRSSAEESKQSNGVSKHKDKSKSSHSSSRSVSTEHKSESSKSKDDSSSRKDHQSNKSREETSARKDHHGDKSREDSSSRKDHQGDKKHSSKAENHVKQKQRDERSPHGSKDRSHVKVPTSGEKDKVKAARHGDKHSEGSSVKSKERRTEAATCNGEEKERRKDPERKMTAIRTGDGSIDCLSGASFAEALGMVNPTRRSPVTTSRSPSKPPKASPVKPKSSSASRRYADGSPADFDFPSPSSTLEPLDCDLAASIEVPPINPHYRPLPNAYNPFDSPPPNKKMKSITDDEQLAQLMYHKAERTRVYSGVKGSRRGQPASLFDSCVRVLQDNIDLLGYTGGVPYSILKPVLEKASAEQLLELEHFNAYLVEDSDELWEYHAKKQFRTLERQEMESYRELFMRGLDERAAKLEVLKSKVKQTQATSVPVRKAKMTYMDSVAKPPREVARQQARNGTARPVPRGIPGASSSPNVSRAPISVAKQKPRVAPLMQKAMKFAKTYKR